MKASIKITLCSSLLMASVFSAKWSNAQENNPTKEAPKAPVEDLVRQGPQQIRIYLECIEISSLEYADLMTKATNSNDHTAMRAKLLEMVSNGKAKLVFNQSLVSRSGERATAESIREFIYPTEYEPGETYRPKEGDTPEMIENFPILPPTATAFETRNLGHTLEVEPIIGADGKKIDITFRPESVKYTGENVMAVWKTKNAETNVQMPHFYTMRTNTAFTVNDGEFLLVNTNSPELDGKPDHSRKVLQFVRAEILKMKAAK